jgi:hypothetical protein
MEIRLGDRIEGRCSGLEHKLTEAEQCIEEQFILLEMPRTESKSSRAEMEQRVEGLKLEVHRINRFL